MKTFKVSNDARFAEKLDVIVGLYVNPPEHAIVLCADEKSQIQALDRTQPGLPIKKSAQVSGPMLSRLNVAVSGSLAHLCQ